MMFLAIFLLEQTFRSHTSRNHVENVERYNSLAIAAVLAKSAVTANGQFAMYAEEEDLSKSVCMRRAR